MPELTPEQQQSFARVIQYADKLSSALADLEAAGGLRGLAGRIKPGSIEKAAASLKGVGRAIDEQIKGRK